ncbi:MAG: hypothetical protein KA054_04035 [Candidatus Moranbacteria bacterium]|nr:hypothetical protein [Candidatus Moranbacteria bacterium]
MNYTEEFDGLLMDPGLIHYANQMHSKEDFGAGIFEDFEMSSLPDEPAEGGNMYSLVAVTCDDGRHWRVASIPIRNARDMEAFAKRKGFVIKDSRHASWELQVTSLFVLERNPGYIDTDPHQHRLQ